MSHFALIACANGLGHTRRTLILSNEICSRGHNVTILAPSGHVARIVETGFALHGQVQILDLDTRTSSDALRQNPQLAEYWMSSLPSLDLYDIVVSDNLPEVLERRPDTVISGHFFWHLSLEGVANDYAVRCENLLREFRPRIISTKLLLDDRLKDRGICYPVGLFGHKNPPSSPKKDLLITTGLGGENPREEIDLVEALVRQSPEPFQRIHVEPRLVPAERPAWVVAATYDQNMYDAIQAIVCRPGAGTVTDGLLVGARIFCFYEPGNGEMTNNAVTLARYGVGDDCGDIKTAIDQARLFANSPADHESHRRSMEAIEDGGHVAAADLLESWAR